MNPIVLGRLAVALVSLCLLACATPTPLADLAIESVTVVDAPGGARTDQRVVTRGDRIVWVGPMGQGGPPAKRTIDGAGRFLIPGLWDMHVHFFYDPELTDAMGDLFLAHGVTSVRDTGGDLSKQVALRDAWKAATRPVPRFFFSGPLLDGSRVVYDGATGEQPELGTSVPSPEAARDVVRALHARGASFIKIYELVSPEVFEALVGEARRLGMPIASHVPLSLTADVAGPRTDSMEHLRNLELACAAGWRGLLAARRERIQGFGDGRGYELRRELHSSQRLPAIADYDAERCAEVLHSLANTIQVPTLHLNTFNLTKPHQEPEWNAGADELPEAVRRRWHAAAEELRSAETPPDTTFAKWSLFLVGELRSHAVPIGAGTDTPIKLAIPGESLHRELELLVRSGLSPREALSAATVEPARFFSLENEMGRIESGMRADLVLLGGDPLLEIRNTRRIEGVVSQGRWLERRATSR